MKKFISIIVGLSLSILSGSALAADTTHISITTA